MDAPVHELKARLSYDPSSPSFLRWINGKKNQKPAGCRMPNRYYRICLNKNRYMLVHRAIWSLHYGEIPLGFVIDHIDGNPENNHIDNLRSVTKAINGRNFGEKNNKNMRGVYRNKYMWCASASIDGKKKEFCFSINRLGDKQAYEMACQKRRSFFGELKKLGYTDLHLENYRSSDSG